MRATLMGALLLALVFCISAEAQTVYVEVPADWQGKRLHIGANPCLPNGFPADSAQALGLKLHSFAVPIWVNCLDRNGKSCEGWVDPYEPLLVSTATETDDLLLYRIHYVQRCGNPVIDRGVEVSKVRPQGQTVILPPAPTPLPPPAEFACCFADGSCELLTEEECEAAGGTCFADYTSCEQNPCPPPPAELTEEAGGGIPCDAWLGAAMSKSLESRALDSFEGLYIDFPLTPDQLTLKFAGATSQSNFDKFRGGVTHHRAYAANLSRLQTGFMYRPWDRIQLIGLVGAQYDHKVSAWQPGWLLEGNLQFPIGLLRNEEDITYQTGTEALWFRTRHWIPVLTRGVTVWSVGGEFMRNAFRDNPGGRFYHYYTTRGHGFIRLDSTWLNGTPFTVLAGVGRGSEHEDWGMIVEAGTRLW